MFNQILKMKLLEVKQIKPHLLQGRSKMMGLAQELINAIIFFHLSLMTEIPKRNKQQKLLANNYNRITVHTANYSKTWFPQMKERREK